MEAVEQQSELAALGRIDTEDVARVLAQLVRSNRELRRAILTVVQACPNIETGL